MLAENERLRKELADSRSGNSLGEEQYNLLFDSMPLAAQEENYSDVKREVDRLVSEGVDNLQEYLRNHPKLLYQLIDGVRIFNINQAMLDLHGATTREEFVAEEDDIDSWWNEKWVDFYACEIASLAKNNSYVEAERSDTRYDGSYLISRSFSFLLAGHENSWARMITIQEDITSRKEMENDLRDARDRLELQVEERTRELRESETQFKQAAETANLGHWRRDLLADRYISLSEEFARIFGFDVDTFLSQFSAFDQVLNLVHSEDRAMVDKLHHLNDYRNLDYRILHADGSTRYVRETQKIISNSEGKQIESMGTLQDVTELKEAQLKAEQASDAKSAFLATMSHEIRTPMNAVIGMTQLMEDTALTDQQKDYVKTITRSSNSLLSIINDILDFSKIEAQKAVIESIAFDLERVCQESLELVSGNATDRPIEFIFDYNPDCPRHFYGDPSRFRQILVNLIGNAAKFTQHGYVRLSISYNDVDHSKGLLTLQIQDTGIGLKPEAVDGLFDEFTQADNSTTREYGGTGLGLAISKKLVTLMGGRIEVDSVFGEGTSFWITVPLAVTEVPPPLPCASLRGVRVLFVHDGGENHPVFTRMLDHMGVKVTELADPHDTLGRLCDALQGGEPFKIVILDCHFEDTRCVDLGKKIRANNQFDELKLLIFSAIADKGDATYFAKSGFDAYLNKITRYETLKAVLAAMLEHHSGQPVITQHSIEDVTQSSTNIKMTKSGFVLLVEDIKPNQIVAHTFLTRMGFDVEVANNGEEAISAYKSNQFDLILMDCRMPVMDGYEATRSIRALEKENSQPALPIIALTANASSDDRLLCMQSGMNDVITKPFKRTDLSECLQKWLPDG